MNNHQRMGSASIIINNQIKLEVGRLLYASSCIVEQNYRGSDIVPLIEYSNRLTSGFCMNSKLFTIIGKNNDWDDDQ